MKNYKKFDSVKMMRDIRAKLSASYMKSPEKEQKDLEIIRKKYGIKQEAKQAAR
ncbi:MAG: hypothetical protein KAX28_09675 [Candidatus Marinimicrobia bacterium]|nr:hypothetical protein [Candidatus Neomarinimicrobiota bacterium]